MFMREVQEALNEVEVDKDEVGYKICMDGISQIEMNLKERGMDLSLVKDVLWWCRIIRVEANRLVRLQKLQVADTIIDITFKD